MPLMLPGLRAGTWMPRLKTPSVKPCLDGKGRFETEGARSVRATGKVVGKEVRLAELE